ncbi:hypothetical protein IFM58399_00987 [Aspergillus lentulus]|uniref:Transmembrane protein n=1 Tax=Aspergillus lentulus TaxID=293939 RepID=A0ABQ1AII9_ASPLE|nr:uncharacterized protein IFM58399_00987 [Aspergillus lentulus]GFF25317.1 hypothetical protein IFM58399_00987 [Aspergillus lentulus]GFF61135.1 hypothetical protein IFM62136_04907 [Aspergillus lentulus]GFF82516.1 hypothetical protein IFM60648_06382 [Aspergillus lentulus]GFF85637.1 hypothetical protein IFM47457_06886 [Aspergillus lentulus]GFG00115.1 hypothetical protein IFM61392_01208 [Aspergillus lentulus]
MELKIKPHLSLLLLLLSVAIAWAAPIQSPISTLHTRQELGPEADAEAEAEAEPEAEALDSLLPSPFDSPLDLPLPPLPKPEPLDVDSMLANSPLSDFYKMIKEEVKGMTPAWFAHGSPWAGVGLIGFTVGGWVFHFAR